jgi:pimeloyl-ACP methyl ester carboxylesterase
MLAMVAGLRDHDHRGDRRSDRPLGDDTVLFGHSMNGTLVLAAAAATPCRGVIAVAPPTSLSPNPDLSKAFWEARAEPARKKRTAEIVEAYERAGDDAEKQRLQGQFEHLRRWYDLDLDTKSSMRWR